MAHQSVKPLASKVHLRCGTTTPILPSNAMRISAPMRDCLSFAMAPLAGPSLMIHGPAPERPRTPRRSPRIVRAGWHGRDGEAVVIVFRRVAADTRCRVAVSVGRTYGHFHLGGFVAPIRRLLLAARAWPRADWSGFPTARPVPSFAPVGAELGDDEGHPV
jgi:hypothetical protein